MTIAQWSYWERCWPKFCILPVSYINKIKQDIAAGAPGLKACLHNRSNFVGCNHLLKLQFCSLPIAKTESSIKLDLKT